MGKTLNKKSRNMETQHRKAGDLWDGGCMERDLGRCRRTKGHPRRPSYWSRTYKEENEREGQWGSPLPSTPATANSLALQTPDQLWVEQMTEWVWDRQVSKQKEGWQKQQPTTMTKSPGSKHKKWWPKHSVSTETIPKHASIQKLLCPPLYLKSKRINYSQKNSSL